MSYMVFVQDKKVPKKIHNSLWEASQEAHRLAKMPDNIWRKVFVLEITACYQACVSVSEISPTNGEWVNA